MIGGGGPRGNREKNFLRPFSRGKKLGRASSRKKNGKAREKNLSTFFIGFDTEKKIQSHPQEKKMQLDVGNEPTLSWQ